MSLPPSPSLADLGWLVGCWRAVINDSPNDCDAPVEALASELCILAPQNGVCAGVWHLGTTSLSLLSIRESDGHVEWCTSDFDVRLRARGAPVRFLLRGLAEQEAVFESEGETGHARINRMRMAFTRGAPDTLMIRFLVPGEGEEWVPVREEPHQRADSV
jgi:hypothetical protein